MSIDRDLSVSILNFSDNLCTGDQVQLNLLINTLTSSCYTTWWV